MRNLKYLRIQMELFQRVCQTGSSGEHFRVFPILYPWSMIKEGMWGGINNTKDV